jgi:hypothetical protein
MPKVAIYVSDDLKERMDQVEKHQPNWSALAQQVFRVECERLVNRKAEAGKMQAAIERLRESKKRYESKETQAGTAAGRQWALERAEYGELERLEAYEELARLESMRRADERWRAADLVARQVMGDEWTDARDSGRFWELITDSDELPSDEFADAFAAAAVDVFAELQRKL